MKNYKNPTTKGHVGEKLIELNLIENNWIVYQPVIDDKGVDFLVNKEGCDKFIKIQVKHTEKIRSKALFLDVKSSSADYIAIPCKVPLSNYAMDLNKNKNSILYIKNKHKNKRWSKHFNLEPSRPNEKVNWWKDYTKPLSKIIKG